MTSESSTSVSASVLSRAECSKNLSCPLWTRGTPSSDGMANR